MKNEILKIMYELSKNKIAYNLAVKQVLDLFVVSESDFENKLYSKCLDKDPNLTIEDFEEALEEWVNHQIKNKQIEEFDPHSR